MTRPDLLVSAGLLLAAVLVFVAAVAAGLTR
jgi:hypothetical protein